MDLPCQDNSQGTAAETLGLTRRGHLTGLFSAFCTVMLAQHVSACAPARRMAARDWIDRQSELARALKTGGIRPVQWMDEVARLAHEIDVAALMHDVRQARLVDAGAPPTNDPHKHSVQFLDDAGQRRQLGYAAALFNFAPHNVITPHGHRNMVSAHLVVEGRLRIRNFDRLRDEKDGIVIRPTRDEVASVGTLSAMSSDRDNIHWFVPQAGPAATFDVIISGIDPDQPDYDITAIDPVGGRMLPDGSLLAPRMEFEHASAKYTASI